MATRRRQRFTVSTHLAGETKNRVILAPDDRSARLHYERKGYRVLSVRKGDYRAQAARAQRNAQLRTTGARPNMLSIRTAIKELGLRYPVDVKVIPHKSGRSGQHKAILGPAHSSFSLKHEIFVKDWLSADEMGGTLWHELTHAMQWERDIAAYAKTNKHATELYKEVYNDGTSYKAKGWEREANRAKANNSRLRLAR